jgi:NADPH-dependent curcumin reductase CurA
MKTKCTQVIFKSAPTGLPTPENFEIVESQLADPGENQFLVRNEYLSLDPYMRMLMGGGWQFRGYGMTPGQVMIGRCLGVVTKSLNQGFKEGDRVIGSFGWQTHALCDGKEVDFKVARRDGIPLSAYLGACGSNGLTAWFGLRVIGEPSPGDTVLVSAAAGSVGSAAGQIAKSLNCRVIGIAGGPEKCRVVTGEFGFDGCCDYKSGHLRRQLEDAAADGVDIYFDNVGGEMLDTILPLLNRGGRVPVCGVLSQYNAEGDSYGVKNTRLIFDKQLRLQGFLVSQYRSRWEQARADLEELVASDRLRYRETIAEGIGSAPAAFIGMLKGRNIGKQLVRIDRS